MKFLKGLSIFSLIVFLLLIIFVALIMPEQFDKHLSQVVALVGTLTALVSVIWTQYNKNMEEENKFKQLDLEKKHQISKEKYQELFEKKIDVYQNLYSEINKFKKQLYDVGRHFNELDENGQITDEELKIEDVNITALLAIFEEIEKNHFVISNKLMISYQNIFDLYKKSSQSFHIMYDFDAIDNPKEEWEKVKDDFYKNYKKLIDDFFNQIDLEIQEIKQVLEIK